MFQYSVDTAFIFPAELSPSGFTSNCKFGIIRDKFHFKACYFYAHRIGMANEH